MTTTTTEHCECCGEPEPDTHDGYTACCNELVCYGGHKSRYGTPSNFVWACCWAMADTMFDAPDGSYRLD